MWWKRLLQFFKRYLSPNLTVCSCLASDNYLTLIFLKEERNVTPGKTIRRKQQILCNTAKIETLKNIFHCRCTFKFIMSLQEKMKRPKLNPLPTPKNPVPWRQMFIIAVYYNWPWRQMFTIAVWGVRTRHFYCFYYSNLFFHWLKTFSCYKTFKTKIIFNQLKNEIFTLLLKFYI